MITLYQSPFGDLALIEDTTKPGEPLRGYLVKDLEIGFVEDAREFDAHYLARATGDFGATDDPLAAEICQQICASIAEPGGWRDIAQHRGFEWWVQPGAVLCDSARVYLRRLRDPS